MQLLPEPAVDAHGTGLRLARGSLVRLALAIYFAVYLIAAGAITGQVWLRGGHVTREQWQYHARLEQLGIQHHHGRVDAHMHGLVVPVIHAHDERLHHAAPAHGIGPVAAHGALDAEIVLALGASMAPFITAPAPPTLVPEQSLHLILGDSADLVVPAGERRMEHSARLVFASHIPEPPERPPAAHRSLLP